MATNDLSLIDASKPDGATEFVSDLDNYARELRAALKAWVAIEHDLKGRHKFGIWATAGRPTGAGDTPVATGTIGYNTDLGYIEIYNGTTWKPAQLFERNLAWNAGFERFASSTLPAGWTLTGAGATTARNTTAGQFVFGVNSVTLTRNGTDCNLSQNILSLFPELTSTSYWGSRVVTLGCWVRATVASRARVGINDGTTTTWSNYHSGGSSFEFLNILVTLGATPTAITILLQVDTGDTAAQFDGVVLNIGSHNVSIAPEPLTDKVYERVFGSGPTISASGATDLYVGNGHMDTSENVVLVRVAHPFIARRLYARCSNAPTAGDSYTITLRKNGGASGITCTISETNTTAEDTTNEIAYAAGDTIAVRVVATGGTPASYYTFSLECTPIPG